MQARATPAILDKLTVEYYGAPTKIDQMAAISVPEARLMVIQPWDPTTLNAIQRAILASDLGLNPANDGQGSAHCVPAAHRGAPPRDFKGRRKVCRGVQGCNRSLRRDANDKLKTLKKNAEITEDDQKIGEEKIQKLTDKYVKIVDEHAKAKEKEIMEI